MVFGGSFAKHRHTQRHTGNKRREGETLNPPRHSAKMVCLIWPPRPGQPSTAKTGEKHDGGNVHGVVKEGVNADGNSCTNGTRGKAQCGALGQQTGSGRLSRHLQRISPTGGHVHHEKGQTERQANASVFNEQLQPVVVRMNRLCGETFTPVAKGELIEHVGPGTEPRVDREHRRNGEEPKFFAVFIESQVAESHPHGKTFRARPQSQRQRKRHKKKRTSGQPTSMHLRPAAHDEETQRCESSQSGRNAQVGRARKAQREPDKTRGGNPQEEHLHRGAAPPPNEKSEREKSPHLKGAGQSGAAGEGSRKPAGPPCQGIPAG